MSEIRCPSCSVTIEEGVRYCPHCGSPLSGDGEHDMRTANQKGTPFNLREILEGRHLYPSEIIAIISLLFLASFIFAVILSVFIPASKDSYDYENDKVVARNNINDKSGQLKINEYGENKNNIDHDKLKYDSNNTDSSSPIRDKSKSYFKNTPSGLTTETRMEILVYYQNFIKKFNKYLKDSYLVAKDEIIDEDGMIKVYKLYDEDDNYVIVDIYLYNIPKITKIDIVFGGSSNSAQILYMMAGIAVTIRSACSIPKGEKLTEIVTDSVQTYADSVKEDKKIKKSYYYKDCNIVLQTMGKSFPIATISVFPRK